MTIKHLLPLAALGLCSHSLTAQTTSPQAAGYLSRAEQMLTSGNFTGCIDQCTTAMKLGGPVNRPQAMWLSAVAAYRGGMPQAQTLLTAYCQTFPFAPHAAEAKLMLASLQFFRGNYPGALLEFDRLTADMFEQNTADTYNYRRAFALMKTGRFDEANRLFLDLAKSKEYAKAAQFYRGYIAYLADDYATAQTLLEASDRTSEPGDMADYYLAQIAFKQGEFQKTYNLAHPLLSRPNIPAEFAAEASRLCGESQYALGNNEAAVKLLRRYLDTNANSAPLGTLYIIGLDDYALGNYDSAINRLSPVSQLNDDMGQNASFTIGQCYLSMGNPAAALISFDRAMRLDFDPAVTEKAYYNYAVAQVDGGRIPFGSSVKTLEEFLSRYPQSRYAPTVQAYMVKGYMQTNDYEGALRSLNARKGANETTELRTARQRVLFELGSRALQNGNPTVASEYLTQATALSACNPSIARQVMLWNADADYALGRYEQAASGYYAFLRQAPKNDENRQIASYNLGYALFAQRNYEAARRQFTEAEAMKELPGELRSDILCRIGDTYYYGSNFNAAFDAYSKAYELNPATGDYAMLQQAMMQGHLGNLNQKIATIDRLASLYPQSALRAAALSEKGLTYAAMNKPKEAIEAYSIVAQAYAQTRQGRNALLQMAILNTNLGQRDKGIEIYKQIVETYPTGAEAQLAVEDLKRIYADADRIDDLNDFLTAIPGAPQIDAIERNAIAAASQLKRVRQAHNNEAKLAEAEKMLQEFPDAEGAEEALLTAADALHALGQTSKALDYYTTLQQRASTAALRHRARMGQLRTAAPLGNHALILEVSEQILQSATLDATDVNEVQFTQAQALAATQQQAQANQIYSTLALAPAELYGTRAAWELANNELQTGKLTEAEKRISNLIDANPPHPYWVARSYILLSDILRAQNNAFEADEYLRALHENYPGTDADIFNMIDSRLKSSNRK